MRTLRASRLFLVLFLFFAVSVHAAEKTNALDNKVFVGQIKKAGPEAQTAPETISFENGKIESAFFKNFKPAEYFTSRQKETMTFVAQTPMLPDGQLKWFGAVKNKDLDGTLIWYRSGQKPQVYTMKGELKK